MTITQSFINRILLLTFLFILSTSSAIAYELISDANIGGAPNAAVEIDGLEITGTGVTIIPVKLLVSSGTLAMTTRTGLTFYNANNQVISYSPGAELYVKGNQTDLNAGLATLTYTKTSTGTDTLEAALIEPGESYYEPTGHIYEYVSSTLNWNQANSAAQSRTRYGAPGYLTTLFSAGENSYAASRVGAAGWMGASDVASEGVWRWVSGLGSEANVQFWSGAVNGSIVNGHYANWASGEPNNDTGSNSNGEDCAQFLAGGTGAWNDLPCTTTLPGYIVEYGSDATPLDIVFKNISLTIEAAPNLFLFENDFKPTGIAIDTNYSVTFNKSITANNGVLSVYRTSDNVLVESMIATDSAVTANGDTNLVFDLTASLEYETQYYVLLDSGLVQDQYGTNYNGLNDDSLWFFRTEDSPQTIALRKIITYSDTNGSSLVPTIEDFRILGFTNVDAVINAMISQLPGLNSIDVNSLSNLGALVVIKQDEYDRQPKGGFIAKAANKNSNIVTSESFNNDTVPDTEALTVPKLVRKYQTIFQMLLDSGAVLPNQVVELLQTDQLSSNPVNLAEISNNVTKDLGFGDAGDEVIKLQNLLIQNGFTIPGGATGQFANQTQSALIEYQISAGVSPAVGYFGPVTRASMVADGIANIWWQ